MKWVNFFSKMVYVKEVLNQNLYIEREFPKGGL